MVEISSQRKEKEHATKKQNGTFNTSKPEEECYHMLHFAYPHIIRQYRSEAYPFACDFYDPDSHTYFEYNGSWTHGGHFFDKTNAADIEQAVKWKSKGTKFYMNALYNWTVRDVKKRETAEKNSLNYVVFWCLDEVRRHVLDVLNGIWLCMVAK